MKINRNVIELQALESVKPPKKRMHILRERFAEAARKMCAELLGKKRKPQTEDGVRKSFYPNCPQNMQKRKTNIAQGVEFKIIRERGC